MRKGREKSRPFLHVDISAIIVLMCMRHAVMPQRPFRFGRDILIRRSQNAVGLAKRARSDLHFRHKETTVSNYEGDNVKQSIEGGSEGDIGHLADELGKLGVSPDERVQSLEPDELRNRRDFRTPTPETEASPSMVRSRAPSEEATKPSWTPPSGNDDFSAQRGVIIDMMSKPQVTKRGPDDTDYRGAKHRKIEGSEGQRGHCDVEMTGLATTDIPEKYEGPIPRKIARMREPTSR